ncbi:hypothetical protein BKH42_07765 [Helicobacter sp. 13S00482-2]|uniref:TolC family protein n=1 Tax=Helicobacter sp. 13S00482-2 TaxID=1476200 RepID=UPI000BD9D372|nr:TolC family protein [Helicobacter sp. 13S00482-2]PAF53118.1 hypothetical protein BKH42_07765 [Helicobacter sp. 13S00482-2]
MRYVSVFVLVVLSFSNLFADDLLSSQDNDSLDLNIRSDSKDPSIYSEVQKLSSKSAHSIGLQDLLKGADTNYSLQSKMLTVEQSRKNHTIAQVSFLPTLNLDYTLQNNYRDTAQYNNYNTQTFNAKLNLDIFSGFSTINTIKEKSATYRSNVADMEYTRENIYLQVIQQYYQYFDNVSQLLSLQRKLEQINSDISRVSKLYEQGLTTIDDLESLKSQGSLSEYQISDMKLSIEQNKLMLEYLTNLSFDTLRRDDIATPAYEIKERKDLTSLKEQINASIYQNKQLNYYPTVSFFDTYTYNIELPKYIAANPILAPTYPQGQNIAGLTVSLKLFDDIGLTLQKQYMKLGQLASEKNLLYKQAEQKKDEKLYRKSLEIAKAKIVSSEASLKSATISYQNIKKKYDAQLVNFTDYLQALSTKFDAEATYNSSLNNYELQKANYIFYSGQKIQDYIK